MGVFWLQKACAEKLKYELIALRHILSSLARVCMNIMLFKCIEIQNIIQPCIRCRDWFSSVQSAGTSRREYRGHNLQPEKIRAGVHTHTHTNWNIAAPYVNQKFDTVPPQQQQQRQQQTARRHTSVTCATIIIELPSLAAAAVAAAHGRTACYAVSQHVVVVVVVLVERVESRASAKAHMSTRTSIRTLAHTYTLRVVCVRRIKRSRASSQSLAALLRKCTALGN